MAKSSIHLQTAKGGTILHNARENYSKSVVFTDEKNELWNDSKTAFKLFREELEIRTKAYTERTGQKLHKNTSTLISGVVNLEQHHTLEDLIPIKKYLEDKFDTKVIQMSVHRDEGKLISIDDEDEKLVSGIDFFLNPTNKKLYYEKEFINEIDMSKWKMEKNYHGHFEMLGIDTQGKTFRHKMNIYALKQLQDFTAETLKMERTPSNVIVNEKGEVKRKSRFTKKRLDTHEFKAKAKAKNDAIKESLKDKAELKKDNKILKQELEELKKENLKFREELKAKDGGVTREEFKLQEDLNRKLQQDLKDSKIELSEALAKIEELKKEIFHPTLKKSDDTPAKYKEVANHYIKENKELKEKVNTLETQNKSLEEQNKVLENKVIVLEEKINSSSNMNDYEQIKKENEELKKENASLKEKVKSILAAANEKIKSLFQFKIWNNYKHKQTKFDLEYINENKADFWDELAHYHPKIETLYNENIENELIKIPGEKDYSKMNLEDILNLNKEDLKEFKKEATKATEELKEYLEENKETVVYIRKNF